MDRTSGNRLDPAASGNQRDHARSGCDPVPMGLADDGLTALVRTGILGRALVFPAIFSAAINRCNTIGGLGTGTLG